MLESAFEEEESLQPYWWTTLSLSSCWGSGRPTFLAFGVWNSSMMVGLKSMGQSFILLSFWIFLTWFYLNVMSRNGADYSCTFCGKSWLGPSFVPVNSKASVLGRRPQPSINALSTVTSEELKLHRVGLNKLVVFEIWRFIDKGPGTPPTVDYLVSSVVKIWGCSSFSASSWLTVSNILWGCFFSSIYLWCATADELLEELML